VLDCYPAGHPRDWHLSKEQVVVGDETGVQGRFQQHVGHVMTGVFRSLGVDLRFSDFRSCNVRYSKVPDIACIDGLGTLAFVGEVKTPWVNAHSLKSALHDRVIFRHFLGKFEKASSQLFDLELLTLVAIQDRLQSTCTTSS
jgi:hypothetical protein